MVSVGFLSVPPTPSECLSHQKTHAPSSCSFRLDGRAREAEEKRKDAVSRLGRAEEEVAELRGRLVYAQALEVNRKCQYTRGEWGGRGRGLILRRRCFADCCALQDSVCPHDTSVIGIVNGPAFFHLDSYFE